MKTNRNEHDTKNHPDTPHEDDYAKSLKDIARKIAILVVRKHRDQRTDDGKKTG